jgi:hypothetical protein
MRKVKVVFQMVAWMDTQEEEETPEVLTAISNKLSGATKCFYEGIVNGSTTGRSRIFSSDEKPGNTLDLNYFIKVAELADDPSARINIIFTARDKKFIDDYDPKGGILGEVREDVPVERKEYYISTANTGKFILSWRIEPIENLDVSATPTPNSTIYVCRQDFGSKSCSTLADEYVEIGILVRGCWGESHVPPIAEQHADITLPTDAGNHRALYGFFAEPSLSTLVRKTSSGSIGFQFNEFKGIVYKNNDFRIKREEYFDAGIAHLKGIVTLFCRLNVYAWQAKRIIDTWERWWTAPPNFIALGRNCSNRLAFSLVSANILDFIEGLDTPYNLYRTLKRIYGFQLRCEAGYMGFDTTGEYKIIRPIEPDSKPSETRASSIDALQG